LKKQQGGLPLKIKPSPVCMKGFYFFRCLFFQLKSRARGRSLRLDFLLTFLSKKKVRKENSIDVVNTHQILLSYINGKS